jgi:hypothetical protein
LCVVFERRKGEGREFSRLRRLKSGGARARGGGGAGVGPPPCALPVAVAALALVGPQITGDA